jgi:hypothetical protein
MDRQPNPSQAANDTRGDLRFNKSPSRRWTYEDRALCVFGVLLIVSLGYCFVVWQAHRPSNYADPLALLRPSYQNRGLLHVSTMTCHGSNHLWSVHVPSGAAEPRPGDHGETSPQ